MHTSDQAETWLHVRASSAQPSGGDRAVLVPLDPLP